MKTQSTKKRSIRRESRALLAASLMLCACGDASESDDTLDPAVGGTSAKLGIAVPIEIEKPLLSYTIVLGERHAVTYRAYEDGAFVVGEQGRLNVDQAVTKSAGDEVVPVGPVALFQSVNPGKPVPAELQKIQDFMNRAAEATGPDDESVSIGSGSASKTDAIPKQLSSNDFLNNFGCFGGIEDVFLACVPNWEGSAFAEATSRWAIFKFAPLGAPFRFDTRIAGIARFSLPLNEGDFWVQTQSGPIVRHGESSYPDIVGHRLDISTSGRHHFSARFHNFKYSNANCAERWDIDHSGEFGRRGTTTTAPICISHHGLLR